jgi:hypothetical protein
MVNVGSSAYPASTGHQPSSRTNSIYYMSPNYVSNLTNFRAASHSMEYTSVPYSAANATSPEFSSPVGALASLNKIHDPSSTAQEFPLQESRRSSFGSPANQGLNSLQIDGNGNNPPYTGGLNYSTTSLVHNSSRERSITNANDSVQNSRSSGQPPVSTPSPHPSETRQSELTSCIASPIGRNPRSDVYSAFERAPGLSSAYPTITGYQSSPRTNSTYYMSPNHVSNLSNFGATSHPMGYTSVSHSAVNATSAGFSSSVSALVSLNKIHDPSSTAQEFPPQESRRSSLGSTANQGLSRLRINGNGNDSPYTRGLNSSTTSLAHNL